MVILDLGWAMDPETTWEVTPAACKADTLIVLVCPAAEIEKYIIIFSPNSVDQDQTASHCLLFNLHFSTISPFHSNFRLIMDLQQYWGHFSAINGHCVPILG